MVAVGDVRRWAPSGLESLGWSLGDRVATLVGLQEELDATVTPDRWVGLAADAADHRRGEISEALRRIVAQVRAVRTATGMAGDAVTAVQHALRETDDLAAAHYFHVGDDGVVRDVAPGELHLDEHAAADRNRMHGELEHRVAQVLRSATDADGDLARVLRAASNDEIDDGAGTTLTAAMLNGMVQGNDQDTLLPPQGGTPADANAYWISLTDAQRSEVLAEHPELIGNLDGIPADMRDRANRLRLPGEIARVQTELAESLAAHERLASHTSTDVAVDTSLSSSSAFAEDRLASLYAVAKVGHARQLLVLDTSGEAVKAAVAVGDVDTADHVAVHVPGMGTTVQDSLERTDGEMRDLRAQTLDQLRRAKRDDESVAVVTWIGYQAPGWGSFVDDADLSDTAATAGVAKGTAPVLSRFLVGIDASRVSDPDLTTLAHSYGSTVAGYALQEGTGVDNAVFYGSPGLGTSDVDDLGVPPGHVYVEEADWDPVADLARFGDDPNQLPGATGLSTDGGTSPDGVERGDASGHSEYTKDQSMAQYNMAVVIGGMPDLAVRGSGFGLGDVNNWTLGHQIGRWLD